MKCRDCQWWHYCKGNEFYEPVGRECNNWDDGSWRDDEEVSSFGIGMQYDSQKSDGRRGGGRHSRVAQS